jgi:hypothetical protein
MPQRHVRGVEVLALLFLSLRTRRRYVVRFVPWPLYSQGKRLQYPMNRRLNGPNNLSGQFREQINLLPVLGIEPWIVQSIAQSM